MKDTPEDVREMANSHAIIHNETTASVLRSYAALLERLARPVSDDRRAFEAWRDSLPEKHWSKYDLSACKLGWDAALESYRAELLGGGK